MLEPWLLLQSILAGIAVAAPVGPMSLLCMQRTLHTGPAQEASALGSPPRAAPTPRSEPSA